MESSQTGDLPEVTGKEKGDRSIWRKKHPEVAIANCKVNEAIKKGLLIRPSQCSECYEKRKLIAHHDDYSKPLSVRWVCRICHSKIHDQDYKGET